MNDNPVHLPHPHPLGNSLISQLSLFCAMLRGGILIALACATFGVDVDAAPFPVLHEHHEFFEHRFSTILATEKHASVWEPSFPSKPRTSTTTQPPVPVNFEVVKGLVFLTTAYVGTPPQPISVVLDLQSSDTYALNHKLDNHLYYDHTKSSTYEANGTRIRIDEGSPYEIDGFVSRDAVAIGGTDQTSQLVVHDHLVVELESPDSILSRVPFDGQIGLGQGRADTTGAPSLVRMMANQGLLLDRPEVGFRLSLHHGQMLFGGIDPIYQHDEFHYYGQHGKGMWNVPLRSVSINGHKIADNIGPAPFSTFYVIGGPADAVDALADAVGAENFALPCAGPGPNITFTLDGGLEIVLTKKDYAVEVRDGICRFMFMGFESTKDWVLGTPFLRKVYTVFDYGDTEGNERIGLAPIKPEPKSSVVPSSPPISMVFRDVAVNRFAGVISIGTPPQPVSLMVSTAQSEFLLLNHKLGTRGFYDHTKSTTYHANGTQIELYIETNNTLEGFASRDDITFVGPQTGDRLVVPDQLLMEVNGPDRIMSELPPKVGGIMGLGPHRANSTGAPSIVRTMVNQQLLPRPVVGIHFDKNAMHVTFGGVDGAQCDESTISYFDQDPSSPGTSWTVPLTSIHVNGSQIVGNAGRAYLLDYGEDCVGPKDEIEQLAAAVGADEFNKLSCDGDGPDLELRLGESGYVIKLTKAEYTLPPVQGMCFFLFHAYKYADVAPPIEGEPWVFGLGLLRRLYTVLDFGFSEDAHRIGLAPLTA